MAENAPKINAPITILIVDDREENRYITGRMLRQAGYHVIEGATGEECLELVARDRPSLVVLDIKLPGIDGFETCRRIKHNPATASIPILHLSASYTESEFRVKGLETGANGYLSRPVDPAELLASIAALLRVTQAEEAARLLALQWQATFDAISDGVALLDAGGIILRCNLRMLSLLRPVSGELIGRDSVELMDALLGTDRCRPCLDVLTSRHRETLEQKAGDRWYRITCDPVLAENGELTGVVHIVSDITSRKAAEEELRAANQQLAGANEKLADADRRKDEFLAMLAHELRNPLAPVRNAVQILRIAGADEQTLHRQREIIERQVTHMARLLDDLLDVSRITQGKITLQKLPLHLTDVLAHAIETIHPMIEGRRHKLHLALPPDGLRVEGDVDRLAQVVGNLLANAAKYTDMGGEIWLEAVRDEGRAVIRVRDTGMGIAPEMLPQVFDLFAQADQSLGRSQGGLGIGLTMARALVHMHGGTMGVKSAGLGQGSEFTVSLPVLADLEPEPAALPAAPGNQPDLHPRRILVVDDVVDTATSLAELLGLWGHEVLVAHDGPGALRVARHFRPEIVLLDIGLPGQDGYEVAQRLRQIPETAGSLLVALTGYGQTQDREATRAAGFDHHLVKPVDLSILRNLLTHALV